MTRGFGVAGSLPHDVVRPLAEAVEDLGFSSFWVNDTPDGDGLAVLEAAASTTQRIGLGVAVLPLDRWPPDRILARVSALGLPLERLTIGVGAGRAQRGLATVRAGVEALRRGDRVRLAVGALGPKMCALAGEIADAALLNWLTPGAVAAASDLARRAAEEGGRPAPTVLAYVRTALPAASDRLREEAGRYGGYPSYAAHFARMGVEPLATAVAGATPREIGAALAAFDSVLDETIVRAITADDSLASYLALADAAAPR